MPNDDKRVPTELPLVTIITPCYKTPAFYLERLAMSLWPVHKRIQWVVVNDSPDDTRIDVFAERMASCFTHFKYVRHDTNRGIFAAYVSALVAADAPYSAILDHDDEVDLAPLVRFLGRNRDGYDLVFTDEAKFSAQGRERYWKPEFDALSAMHYFYMHHITCFRTGICKQMILEEPDAETQYRSCFDIWLSFGYLQRFTDQDCKVAHLPYAAYGWRVHAASTAMDLGQKPKAESERIDIAQRLIQATDPQAEVTIEPSARYVVRYDHALSNAAERKAFAQRIASTFSIGKVAPDGSGMDPLETPDAATLQALARVPVGFLARAAGDGCLVMDRARVPKDSQLARQAARHVGNAPFIAPATTLGSDELHRFILDRPLVLESAARRASHFDCARLNILVV
ncbi:MULTISPECIES: glycosyltransferase [unclassified Caballeronia]|uniref:glycosyltransferase n=1 Tax=unclassified Caballeronia TaxID=2646786 RepID=UPI00285653A9|nr:MULTISPECIES: glycosyltransferase [unclassified Caballeronia]MDR5751446.1 glycosyltransferase [Caballeronia sp. LZ024]MDR5844413.1 glycosyltransferase [Caballeronia sp. LZ031]